MALNWQFKGFDYVSYYNGAYENDDSLTSLAETGANAIETTLEWGINPLTHSVYADSNYTDALSAEAATIRQAVADGLQVMVKPVVDFVNPADLNGTPYSVGDWRTYYNPGAAGSAGANAFFASYKSMLLQEAAVAAANGATALSIGTELDQIAGPSYKPYWDGIISALRTQYPTLKLTFGADWNDAASPWQWGGSGLPKGTGNLATQISFASELDYLGIDAYAPLSNLANPTLQDLIDGWTQTPVNSGATAETYAVTGNQSLISYFEQMATAVGKPLVFTEIGYENASDAASSPAASATNVENDNLQSLLYQAFFAAWSQANDSSMAGAFLYNWDPNAHEVGPGSVAFSPQNLPALSVVDQYFQDTAPALTAPATLGSGLDIPVSAKGIALGAESVGSAFTVTLTASHGIFLAKTTATGGGGAVAGSGTAKLTVSGTLAQVNADLSTLRYEATSASNDTIQISASSGSGTPANKSIAVVYDASFPVLAFAAANPVSGATVNLSGSVNAANGGRQVNLIVNGKIAATIPAGAGGAFATNVTLPTAAVDVVTASLTDAAGNTGYTAPLMIAVAGGLTANFSAANGHVVNLFNAATAWDIVNGSNGYVILHGSKTTVNGGGDQIYTDSAMGDALKLAGTAGNTDFVSGYNTAIELDNAQVKVQGGSDPVRVANGAANAISGSGGLAVTVDAGASVALSGAAAYQVSASQAALSLRAAAHARLTGAQDTVALGTGASLHIVSGGGDIVTAGANDQIYDGGAGTLFKVGGSTGTLKVIDFAADLTGVIDLINGAGGYATAGAALSALVNDGAGGSTLSLGASGAIDFVADPVGHFSAANFRIG